MADSKEIYDTLLNDQRFWEKPEEERLEIIDFAANKYAAEDMPEPELMSWSDNRRRARMVTKLGVDGFNKLIGDIQATPDGEAPPVALKDPRIEVELAPPLPLGQTMKLSSSEEGENPMLKAIAGGVTSPAVFELGEGTTSLGLSDQPGEILSVSDDPGSKVELKFVPHPTKFLLDISTPDGTKRHKFGSYEEVPKNGREMSQFLASNYGKEFGIGEGVLGIADTAGSQAGAVGKKIGYEAARTLYNVPTMLDASITNIMMGDKGQEFAENNTLDKEGNVIPMPEDLKRQLYKEAAWMHRSSSSGGDGSEYGFGGQPSMTIEQAFVKAHQEYLKKIGPIPVTGSLSPKMRDEGFDFTADDRFAPLERLELAGNPDVTEGLSDRKKFLQEGDTVDPAELLAAHVAVSDAPKAKELSSIWRTHMENMRTIDETYGQSVEQNLRSSRDGIVQKALNFQQDAAGMIGQMLPVIPVAIATGGGSTALSAAALAPGSLGLSYTGNMAESVGTIYQDQIQSGANPRDAIIQAVDGGMASAAVAAPIDYLGDIVLSKALSGFGKIYKEMPPTSQAGLAKRLASMMDEASGVEPSKLSEFLRQGTMQAVSEFSGEFTRAQVADMYRDNPDGAVANAKQALYEGALAFVGLAQTSAANNVTASAFNAWSDWKTNKAMEAGGYDANVLREVNKLAPVERQERLRELMDAKDARESEGVPGPTVNGAAIIPARQAQTALTPTPEQTISDAFANAPVTADEAEIEALTQLGINPGDIVDYEGNAVRILGAPLSADRSSVEIRGIDHNGNEVVIPESALPNLVSTSEGQEMANEQETENVSPPVIEDLPEPAPKEDAAPVTPETRPRVSFNGAKLGNADLQLTPSTVNFAQSSIGQESFDVSPDGTASLNFGKLPNTGRPITISLNPVEGATTEGTSSPAAGPTLTARSYDASAPIIEDWARNGGYWLRGTQRLGDFIATNGLNPSGGVTNDAWSGMDEYLNELPVVLVDGNRDSGTQSVKALNVRLSRGNNVADGIIIPTSNWQGMTNSQRSFLLAHEVLHSAIGDWSQAAQSETASADMRSTFKEMGEVGESLLKAVRSASSPEGIAFREHFSSVFDGPHYTPENSPQLVEELLIRGLTDSRARQMMQSVTPDMKAIQPNEGNQVTETFWDKVVSLFRKALGFSKEGQQPLQSLFDRFLELNTQIRDQRSTITLTPRYASKDAAMDKAEGMGLPKGSYTLTSDAPARKRLGADTRGWSESFEIGNNRYDVRVVRDNPSHVWEIHFGANGSLGRTGDGFNEVMRKLIPIVEDASARVAVLNPDAVFRINANSAQKNKVFRRALQRAGFETEDGYFKPKKGIDPYQASFRLVIGEIGMADVREAQRELDRNIALNWQLEEGAEVTDQLQSRMNKIIAAQNKLAAAQEAFFSSMASTTALNVIMTPDQVSVVGDETYNKQVAAGEGNVSNRFVLRQGVPQTLLDNITDAGKHQEEYLRSAVSEAVTQWQAGFRSFAAWKQAMEKRFPTLNLTSLWDNLQQSLSETLRNIGSNGTTSLRYDKSQAGLARQEEYATFLKNPTLKGARSFLAEAEEFSKTKMNTSSRAALFNHGPLASDRNRFVVMTRDANGRPVLDFNNDLYEKEYKEATASASGKYRVADLDTIPEAVRQTKERLKGVRQAKGRMRTIFTDMASRYGVDKEGASAIWKQITFPTSVNSAEMGAAIDGALIRAERQLGLSADKKTKARRALKAAAKEFKRSFRRAHNRSPEAILDQKKADAVVNAAKDKTRNIARGHGYNAASMILRYGSEDMGLHEDAHAAFTAPFRFLVEGERIPVAGEAGFSPEVLEKLKGASLDATYRTAFISGARSALVAQAIRDGNDQTQAISDIAPLWLGETVEAMLVGGQDFSGKDLFTGLIQPMFEMSMEYHRSSAIMSDIVTDGGGISSDRRIYPGFTNPQMAEAQLNALKSTYDFMLSGESQDASQLKERLATEVTLYDSEFEGSFDATALRFMFGMTDNITDSAFKRAEDYSFTGTLTPGQASKLLRDIQDLRGALLDSNNDTSQRAADFSSRGFADPESTREDRRNRALAWQDKIGRREDWNLKVLQTKALVSLAGGDPSSAMALARLLMSESVDSKGYFSRQRVSDLIEDQLVEAAAAENNATFLRQRPLEQILPRIERMIPLSPQAIRLALADGGAELSNLADTIESFAAMEEGPMGNILAGFLKGNTRPIPVLLIDTQRMNETSRQAFRQSDLLRGKSSSIVQPNEETNALYSGDFVVVDVGQSNDQAASRILGEAMRDMFAQPGTQGLQRKAERVFSFFESFSTNLDHGINELAHDIETGLVRDPVLKESLRELMAAGEKWGGYSNMGAIPLAIEVLSNPTFRQSLSLAPGSYFSVTPEVKSPAGTLIMEQARAVAASDLNEASRKHLDFGLSYDDISEQDDFSDDDNFGNVSQAFERLSFSERPSPPSFAEQAIANAMELLFTASQLADFSGFADQSMKYTDTVLPGAREEGRIALDTTATEVLAQDGSVTPEGAAAINEQAQATAGVLRSLSKRFGANVDQWINDHLEEQAGVTVESLPGASAKEAAFAYQLKAMAIPDNVLFSGNKLTYTDENVRREQAKEMARDFWRTIMGAGERMDILKDIASKQYSLEWMRDNPLKWLEDLAEFAMRPTTSDGVRGHIWSAVSRGVSTDAGSSATGMRDIHWHLLFDKWREIMSADIAGKFLTNAKFNPVTFYGNPLGSMKNFSSNSDIYRIYGAASPALRDNIIGLMGIMDAGSTGNRGHTGFKSRMIGYEDRFAALSKKMGAYKSGYVRATLAGYLTQYAENSTEAESVAKMADELRKGLANLKSDGKNALASYKLRHLYDKEMAKFLPLADAFAAGHMGKDEYEISLLGLLNPDEMAWLSGVRDMFAEIQPSMEVSSRLLGRKQGRFTNYLPMMNGRVAHDSAEFLDNQFRPLGEKVGTSRPRSMNTRFDQNPEDGKYILDLDGSHIIGMLRRDVFTMETVAGGLLLHETIGTRNDKGGKYTGQIEKIGQRNLSTEEFSKLDVTLSGLRGTYDRTRSGFQSGINVDNRTRRFLTTMSQVGAFFSLAAVEQLWKQTIPGFIVYMGRMAGNVGFGDTSHLTSFLEVTGSLGPGNKQLRANMHGLMKRFAPGIYLRGTDGNAAFKEKLSLELKEKFGDAPFVGVALDHVASLGVGAIRGFTRRGLEYTTGAADSLLADRIFYTEYARRAKASGLTFSEAFEPSNWNVGWASQAKASTEQIVGTSSLEERGAVMQMKGTGVGSEFISTILRAFGSHNISLASHSRALANEFQYGSTKDRTIAASKMAEITIQNALFNAMSKPIRDLVLSHIIATLVPGEDRDQEEIYQWLLENVPWERKPQPITSGYDWMQTRGWRTLFDSAPVLGSAGAALSLPVVNDIVREALSERFLKPATAELMDEDYTPFKKDAWEIFSGMMGYTGAVMERIQDVTATGTSGTYTDFSDDNWGPAAIGAIATRDLAGRIFQEYKGEVRRQASGSGSSASPFVY